MPQRKQANVARLGNARSGRTLTAEEQHEIRRSALVNYIQGKINENLYLGRGQVSRVYRAMVDKIDTQVEAAEKRGHTTAVSGGKLKINGVDVDVLSTGG